MSSHRFTLETIRAARHGSVCLICEQRIDSGYLVTFNRPPVRRFKVHKHCAYFFMQSMTGPLTPEQKYECERNLFHVYTVLYPYAIVKPCFCGDFVRTSRLNGLFSALDPGAPRTLHRTCCDDFTLTLKDHFS